MNLFISNIGTNGYFVIDKGAIDELLIDDRIDRMNIFETETDYVTFHSLEWIGTYGSIE